MTTSLQKSSTSKTELVAYATPVRKIKKPRNILVVYRDSKPQNFDCGSDTWMFLSLTAAHYGVCGRTLDVIFLMDGITQNEFIHDSGYTVIYPNMTLETIILEAG